MSELITKMGEPRHPDFVKIYKQFVKRYGKEDGARYYYMWLNHLGLDDTKSYGSQASFEAFTWATRVINWFKDVSDAKLYKVEAIFPLTSMNNNVYTEDELLRGTRTLIGKPVNLNHDGHPIDGIDIIGAEYEDGCAECLLKIMNDAECRRGHSIQGMIDSKEIWNVSIEAKCTLGFGGAGCAGLNFTGLGLLTKDTLPGVPMARIYSAEGVMSPLTLISAEAVVVERIVESFKPQVEEPQVGEPYPNEHACRIRDPADFQKGSFRRIVKGGLAMILGRLKGKTTMTLQAFRYPKGDWSVARARSHCKRHDGSFEPASESEKKRKVRIRIKV